MKQTLIILVAVCTLATVSMAETRAWTFNNGKTIEAEFVSLMGGKVSLKTKKGKLLKIPRSEMSSADMTHIELMQPPTLDFSFSKMTRQFTYAPLTEWFEQDQPPPESLYYTFSTQIKQTSANSYDHELTAEVFVMAVEADGGKNILIDRRKETFRLGNENNRTIKVAGAEELMLTNYIASGGRRRGEKLAGYMVVVTDSRGEVVGHATTRDWWYEKVDNLRMLPVGKTFDEEGKRCWPTRPQEPDY